MEIQVVGLDHRQVEMTDENIDADLIPITYRLEDGGVMDAFVSSRGLYPREKQIEEGRVFVKSETGSIMIYGVTK